jgi:hypothetical protein
MPAFGRAPGAANARSKSDDTIMATVATINMPMYSG